MRLRHLVLCAPAMLFLLGLPVRTAADQAPDMPARELLRYLTFQSSRPGRDEAIFTVECGRDLANAQEDRRLVQSLLEMRPSAMPEVESALDSLEKDGRRSPFAVNGGWLFYAYAKVEGRAAYPRLERMIQNPKLRPFQYALDASVALALGITSFVDSFRVQSEALCRVQEPRDSLDRLIIAWERNDRKSFLEVLGPGDHSAVRPLAPGRDWDALRKSLWVNEPAGAAVGYHFMLAGQWSEPEETLDQVLADQRTTADFSSFPTTPEIETEFSSASLSPCGRARVKFVQSRDAIFGRASYLIDDANIEEILRIISSCAR